MTPSRRNGQPSSRSAPGAREPVEDELRSWIDHVIVPILLQELLREKNLQGDESDG